MGAKQFDFSGWATRNDLRCSDGRTIRKDAFKHNDGNTVPLVWNHQHNDSMNVLGHALLENRDEGVYVYGTFNDTEAGQNAKLLVQHGDVSALSIYANQLKQTGGDVMHGIIREVSLVLAGANPGAFIDTVLSHGDESDEAAIIYTGEDISLSHSDDENDELEHAECSTKKDEEKEVADNEKKDTNKDMTVQEVFDTMNEDQKNVCYALVGAALEDAKADNNEDEPKGGSEMKHNVFETDQMNQNAVLSHADQENIIALAKSSGVGSFQDALSIYASENESLAHSIDNLETLFPEYKDVYPGEPETITRDMTWVDSVINGTHKSPVSRVRTRQLDAKQTGIRANGYKQKGDYKKEIGNVKLLSRTTDPQTIYVKDKLNRDDIVDFTDFDIVNYQYKIMRMALNEEIALAIMVGDGREEGDEMKIEETHVRSIWHDDELYTIHTDVDITAQRAALQGNDTADNFGDNYIYAESIITAALYGRENYKGSGSLTFYCTPHLLNVMLLARDMNGRRIYSSKSDLAAALDVKSIETVEQFEGLTRTTSNSKVKKLLGMFVNLADYQIGSTKGGEITKFNQFDIDFNQEKYLMETRISGALTRIKSAIVLEEDVTPAG